MTNIHRHRHPTTESFPSVVFRSKRTLASTGALLVALSCADEGPVAPPIPATEAVPEMSATLNGSPAGQVISGPLAVNDLLADPLFRSMVRDITDPLLATLLDDAILALEADQVQRAKVVFARAAAEAETLMEAADADLDVLIHWSVIERYLDEAELI
jgi:hypothetical protein